MVLVGQDTQEAQQLLQNDNHSDDHEDDEEEGNRLKVKMMRTTLP
jgi:hypothetical protein